MTWSEYELDLFFAECELEGGYFGCDGAEDNGGGNTIRIRIRYDTIRYDTATDYDYDYDYEHDYDVEATHSLMGLRLRWLHPI